MCYKAPHKDNCDIVKSTYRKRKREEQEMKAKIKNGQRTGGGEGMIKDTGGTCDDEPFDGRMPK